ncbi:nitrilase-related carbon-nitrogen hydrolase [Gordonia sp. CPCC 205515]|uniref:nitrilase-related carbon-nitrogen hydrolase n=1 Tax=Gordonia sp. CPCC 205515 TaxID=3140791 RepID=UPI003AF3B18C
MTRIVCVPLAPQIGEFEANCSRIESAITEAVAAGADIIVLPELATSGYVFDSHVEALRLAVPSDHQALSRWSAVAGSATVVVGFCELSPDGRVFNSAAVVDRTGVRGVYRKCHLWDREKLIFTPGDRPPLLVETTHGRLAIMICYDLEFPEFTRAAALAGADLFAAPVNWPLMSTPAGERPAEQIMAMATARMNGVFVACTDRTGVERGQQWTAGTTIIGTDGWVIGRDLAGCVVADCDLSVARSKKLATSADAFADRRPDVYAVDAGYPASLV